MYGAWGVNVWLVKDGWTPRRWFSPSKDEFEVPLVTVDAKSTRNPKQNIKEKPEMTCADLVWVFETKMKLSRVLSSGSIWYLMDHNISLIAEMFFKCRWFKVKTETKIFHQHPNHMRSLWWDTEQQNHEEQKQNIFYFQQTHTDVYFLSAGLRLSKLMPGTFRTLQRPLTSEVHYN